MGKGNLFMFKHRLNNGATVVGEYMPGFRSVSMGVWINAGSVYERENESGAAHFIEHMLFKGTSNRSASRIAEEMDAVGGNLNAFTGKECTCFYGRVLDRDVSTLSEILADLICCASLDPEDIEREKGVVLEEISMTEDTPEDLVTETATSLFYESDPLEKPILGTADSVKAFTREDLRRYMERLYRPENTVISVAGNFDEEKLLFELEKSFVSEGGGESAQTLFGVHKNGARLKLIPKDIEQVHICMCLPGFKKDTRESYAQLIFSNAFGGSMSSRLFQKIREEKGLAYSVYAYPTVYPNSGYVTLYAGTGAENASTVCAMMLDELRKVGQEGLSEGEIKRAKDQLVSGYLMAQESTSARSSSIGRAELLRGRHLTESEVIERINSVSSEDIRKILETVTDTSEISASAVGRVSGCERTMNDLILG